LVQLDPLPNEVRLPRASSLSGPAKPTTTGLHTDNIVDNIVASTFRPTALAYCILAIGEWRSGIEVDTALPTPCKCRLDTGDLGSMPHAVAIAPIITPA
jgi:hypothetical protein